ncbi:MAG TPA: ornithine carbamoyltransferase [Methanobacteriaceae archaeon]|nr:ornithine carbamoyltransferase [Methanobacteriaceae archaeon]HNS24566.1 ornithine carbamoyltransferase [Methanobacteriaceae archaeon]
MQHVLSVLDIQDQFRDILRQAQIFKKDHGEDEPLKGKTLAMIFEKSSTRTRVSFEVAMYQLGGFPLYLSTSDLQLGRGELIEDTSRAMTRYVDGVMIRAREHQDVVKFSIHSRVPVINGLTNLEHPCQALADMLTILEWKGTFNVKMVYVGDGNNVVNSLLLAAAVLGMDFTVACPPSYEPRPEIIKKALKIALKTGSNLEVTHQLQEAVKNADVLYTDVWVSMGDEETAEQRLKDLQAYQINTELLELANPEAMVLHCLPAVRGQEITEEVLNSPQSAVWDQAENRLHVQKALLYLLLKD